MNSEAAVRIAGILGASYLGVRDNWPLVKSALTEEHIFSVPCAIAALATVRVECGPEFRPVHEFGSEEYLNTLYDTRADLGNTPEKDGDGARYCGRGFIQITGRANYGRYGSLLDLDLVAHPELAMVPANAARILAKYFKLERINRMAEAGEWQLIRRIVNGGRNGMNLFLALVSALQAEAAAWEGSGKPAAPAQRATTIS